MQFTRAVRGRDSRSSAGSYQIEQLEDRILLASFVVENVNNSGAGSLRAAIQAANSTPGLDFIDFNIPGSGVQTIRLTSALPTITDTVFINGDTQPGYVPGQPLIELDGSLAGSAHGLEFRGAGGNLVEGLIVHSFSGIGIVLAEPDNPTPRGGNTLIGNFIGTDATGTLARGNGRAGIHLQRSPNNIIQQNLVSGNTDSGIFISDGFSSGNRIEGNHIGTDITGLSPLGNRLNGISLSAANIPFLRQGNDPADGYASDNLIGGADLELGNVIAGNGEAGVYIFRGSGNEVKGNYIGVGVDGLTPIPNGTRGPSAVFGTDGIWIEDAGANFIGGTQQGAGNLISANVGAGIRISAIQRSADANIIEGNLIGTDRDGDFGQGLGNGGGGVQIRNESSLAAVTASGTVIGGSDEDDGLEDGHVAARNIISGNLFQGINIVGHRSLDTTVKGNHIGTDKSGLKAVPNQGDGIHIAPFLGQSPGSTTALIGGTEPLAGNLISGNSENGIFIGFGARAAVVSNIIGTNKDATAALGNGQNGIFIFESSDNLIGAKVELEPGGGLVPFPNLISANGVDGVQIGGQSRDNRLVSNLIGVGLGDQGLLGNGRHGVAILNAPGNFIGDGSELGRNVIVASAFFGIAIFGPESRFNQVSGNYIGVSPDGAGPRGNDAGGVLIKDAVFNTIGGTADGEGNIISANGGPGVIIEGIVQDQLLGNHVLGNHIGTDIAGALSEGLGNFGSGIYINHSRGNTIQGNILRGNGIGAADGVTIAGPASQNNSLEGNIITHSGLRGVRIFDQASNNTIGGEEPGQRNVISSNADGIVIEDQAADNRVIGNYIGTDEAGEFAEGSGNSDSGVVILESGDNQITGNTLRGNAIGVMVSGAAAMRNGLYGNRVTHSDDTGVLLTGEASSNDVGSLVSAERNYISASNVGIRIDGLAHNNRVVGNLVGSDESGEFNAELGNGSGIVIHDSRENTIEQNIIRGTASGTGSGITIAGSAAQRNHIDENVITHSGLRGIHLYDQASENLIGQVFGNLISSSVDGIVIEGGAKGNLVLQNRIGTDPAGDFAQEFGNSDNGVLVLDAVDNAIRDNKIRGNGTGVTLAAGAADNSVSGNMISHSSAAGILLTLGASGNLIGGSSSEFSNVISRSGEGIRIEAAARANIITGNFIGTDEAMQRNAAFGNTGPGILIIESSFNVIADNGIASNGDGLVIQGSEAIKNAIRANVIIHNRGYGILMLEGASQNPIGGVDPDFANRITNNLKAGVAIQSGTQNAILRNRIFDNGGLGIDLGNDGISFNDKVNDADSGANNLQNFPELTFATVGGSRRIVGTFNSAPNTLYILEFFANTAPDSSGHGQGERFLTTTAVTTNASGVATFDIPLPEGEVAGTYISATATDPNANTSEFSKTIRIEMDTDGDGIPDRLENNGPNGGDGNQDGIPDAQQSGVVSFPNATTGSYVTLELGSRFDGIPAPAGAVFSHVRPMPNPSPGDAPSDVYFGQGFFDFTITGLVPGSGVVVEVILPFASSPTSYYRYGPTPEQPAAHWYNWTFDGFTGAILNGNRVQLHFADGQRGDDDLLANGTIVDPGGPGHAPALFVTNTNDSGGGSLRQAILTANSRPGLDFINFDIAAGPQTINLLSNLPAITDALFIDGTTQSGFVSSPIIELSGQMVSFGTGLMINTANTTVRGLVINRFASAGIRVGGFTFQSGVVIEGNYIGTDISGMLARGNGEGIVLAGAQTRIGGITPGSGNLISGNLANGITGTAQLVQGNRIGVAADALSPLGNGANGVSGGAMVGGLEEGAGNIIAFNQGAGVGGGTILSNSIYSNGGLGIGTALTLNDPGTSDGLLGNPVNYPVLYAAHSADGQTSISGYLNSRPGSTFLLQFFASDEVEPSGFGEGRTLLGSATVQTDENGRAEFTVTFPLAVPQGQLVTATATLFLFGAPGNTSQFSRRLAVGDVLGSVITVNSADDADDGVADARHTSLREAIHAANNFPGHNTIRFAIGSGVATITPSRALPAITDAVTIDGTTQPGFAASPIIELSGELIPAQGLQIHAADTVVRGLVINRFASASGISVSPIGTDPGFANVIIEGNFIGTDITGTLPRPNARGITLRGGAGHLIGGTSPASRNVISGNTTVGVLLDNGGSGYRVEGNYIGVAADGISPLGNGTIGVSIPLQTTSGSSVFRVSSATIGGLEPAAGNVIAFNGEVGVQNRQATGGNAILSNSIHANGSLGISMNFQNTFVLNERPGNLDQSGKPVTYPVLFLAQSAGGQTTISGYLNSAAASSEVLLQFFSNASTTVSGFGDGETFLGSATVTTDAAGRADFTVTLPVAVADRHLITATATDSLGNTSQFSRRLAAGDVLSGDFVVNSVDDADDGVADAAHTSLREAIHAANNHPGPSTIRFAIGTGTRTIAPLTPLPAIVDAQTTIDGTTQPGFAGAPIIEIIGTEMERDRLNRPSATEYYMTALALRSDNNIVRGLVVNRFWELLIVGGTVIRAGGTPLTVQGNGNVIEGNYFGTSVAGGGLTATGAPANRNVLIPLTISGSNNRIGGTTAQQRNVISGHRDIALEIFAASNNLVQGNYIGTNAAGTAAIGNGQGTAFQGQGIRLSGTGNVIGGTEAGAGNVISGNSGDGIRIITEGNLVQGNYIGTSAGGTARLANAGDGIVIDTISATIGGTAPGAGNVISGNRVGIFIIGGQGSVIQGNYIGTDITGTAAISNTMDGIVARGVNHLIGGIEPGAGNLISGNGRFGILVPNIPTSSGIRIEGNRIGTQANGTAARGNGSDGIAFAGDFNASTSGTGPTDSFVGGLEPGAGNIIAFNGRHGVNILAGRRVGILSNSIHSNNQLGIDLNGDGVTPNDPGDGDSGDNELQNYPVLTSVTSDGVRTSITGTLNSTPRTSFILQFFANAAAEPSGFGEGQALLGSRTVVTDAAGNVSFNFTFQTPLPAGHFVSATATDPLNNTSEFAGSIQMVGGEVPGNQPPIASAGGPYNHNEGAALTLSAAGSIDPDDDPLTYSWDINGDGIFGDAVGVTPTLTWEQLKALGIVNGPSSFSVQVRVDDGQGHVVTSDPTSLNVLNVAPVPNAGPHRSIAEGDTVSFTGSFTDPGDLDTHTMRWSVIASNGQVIADGNGLGFEFTAIDDGVYEVTFSVTDNDGDTGSHTIFVFSNSIPPTSPIFGLPAQGIVGVPIHLTTDAIDPSPLDTAAGFTYEWFVFVGNELIAQGTEASLSFTPAVAGTYFIDLYITDKDFSTSYTGKMLDVVETAGVAPVVTLDPTASLDEGSTYLASGSFADPDTDDQWTATVDYGDGTGEQPLLLNLDKTFQLSHVYADNGVYDLVVRVVDDSGLTGTQTTRITVNNVDPVVTLGTPAPVTVGSPFTLSGSFTDAGADTWTATVDYGDGGGAVPLALEPDGSFSLSHVYSTPGSFTVTVTVTDDDGGVGTAQATAQVNPVPNASPRIAAFESNTSAIDEGSFVTVTGSYSDADAGDTHSVTIDWGDGTVTPATVDAATRTFTATRQYLDDHPTATSFDIYTISATVSDNQGNTSEPAQVSLTVNNVAPVPGGVIAVAAGRLVTLQGSITDPGLEDSFTLIVDWGDGSQPQMFSYPAGTAAFQEVHLYGDDGVYGYTISLTLADDDGGVTQAQALVQLNQPPTAHAGGPYVIDEGDGLVLDGSASSDADGDALTYSWDINGDGIFDDAVGAAPSLTWAQLKALGIVDGPASFSVRVRVDDGQGNQTTSPPAVLTVRNVAPELRSVSASAAGRLVTLQGQIVDPGDGDSFTLLVDWGDGSEPQLFSYPAGTAHFEQTHLYLEDNRDGYVIHLTLRDDDGGEAQAQTSVIVDAGTNAAPVLNPITLDATTVHEGGIVTVTGSYSDADLLDSHTVLIDWGDGSVTAAVVDAVTRTFQASHQYVDDDPSGTPADAYTITAVVSDDAGATSNPASAVVTVNNVAPVIGDVTSSAYDGQAIAGQLVSLLGNFTDPGILDTHTAEIDWGDGSTTSGAVLQVLGSGAGSVSGTHAYLAGGIYTITLTLRDDDGGTSTVTSRALITGASVRDGILQIIGTQGDDSIHVNWVKSRNVYRVHANFLGNVPFIEFSAVGITHVMIFGLDGNDQLSAASDLAVPVVLDGGAGNDTLSGGSRSLMIGGTGRDRLIGGRGDDILIGGTTAFDLNPAALKSIFSNTSILDDTTVFDDEEQDELTGGAGRNILFV